MNDIRVDLLSDTVTRPTAAMRRAIANAEVGDEQRGEDPSVVALCERLACEMGKEAAVFLPSGTMCNQVAVLVHCRPGDEIIADRLAHVVNAECAGPSALAGAAVRTVDGRHGIFDAAQTRAAIREPRRHAPRSRVVAIEQTVNRGGGTIWPLARLDEVAAVACERGLAVHMDGARLLNACVASGVPMTRYAAVCDSVWLDLSKGLGCPVGAVLAGSADFIEQAWAWKQRLGGSMRQAGVLAAAGLYALDHHVERLAEDHANARRLAERLATMPGLVVDLETVQTNIVLIDIAGTDRSAGDLMNALRAQGVRVGANGARGLRAVTHLDVNSAQIEMAVAAFARVLGQGKAAGGDATTGPGA